MNTGALTTISASTMPGELVSLQGELLKSLTVSAARKDFLRTLAESLHSVCGFSWLTLSLCEQREEMFADFSSSSRKIINPFFRVPPTSLTSIIAENVLNSRQQVIIPDCMEYFASVSNPPTFQQSASTVIAFPLIFNHEIIGIFNVSFENQPEDINYIVSIITGICPTVAVCLGVVLTLESLKQGQNLEPAEGAAPQTVWSSSVIFQSGIMRDIFRQINTLTKLDVPVLLLGETGTGKTMLAKYIHQNSLRRGAHFVRVNCPSLSSNLFESEMFGHAKGSFTGAVKKRIGRFEWANQGTLFLDEVAELSQDMQSKLLQVLDDRSFERVGESAPIVVDMRVLAATNVNISQAIAAGALRSDLFHRISVCTVEMPPLRRRPEDILPLARELGQRVASRLSLKAINFGRELAIPLSAYYWPGNIRELSNLVTRLVIYQNAQGCLTREDVQKFIEQSETYAQAEKVGQNRRIMVDGPEAEIREIGAVAVEKAPGETAPEQLETLEEMERKYISKVLKHVGGIIAGPKGAAKILGMPRSTLVHRIKKLGVE